MGGILRPFRSPQSGDLSGLPERGVFSRWRWGRRACRPAPNAGPRRRRTRAEGWSAGVLSAPDERRHPGRSGTRRDRRPGSLRRHKPPPPVPTVNGFGSSKMRWKLVTLEWSPSTVLASSSRMMVRRSRPCILSGMVMVCLAMIQGSHALTGGPATCPTSRGRAKHSIQILFPPHRIEQFLHPHG